MRHPGINLSDSPLLSNDWLHLRLRESRNRASEKPRVVTIEDPKVSVVPDDLVSIVKVVRSVVLNLGIHQRLMPVPVWTRKRHTRHPGRLLRPYREP